MKLRFWQKTYLLTLTLFLLCLNLGIFALAFYTYRRSVRSAEEGCRSEQFYVMTAFRRDYDDLMAAGEGADPKLLMESYGAAYQKQGIGLNFYENGRSVYATPGAESTYAEPGTLRHEREGDDRRVILSVEICDGRYVMVFTRSVADLDREFRSLMLTYLLTFAGVSLFLAICLYIVLKKLSTPLERLRKTTEAVAAGDNTIRAQVSGHDEFRQLAISFNAMIDRINDQMEALRLEAEQKQRLVDDLAHELRTPLTSIYGYAEYLRRTPADEEDKIECAICIQSQATRLQKISEKLLDGAFIRNNEIHKERVRLPDLLAETAADLQSVADSRGVELIAPAAGTSGADADAVEGDAVLLGMLFYNLTENAIKACDPGGRITLTCGLGWAAVADTGKGMTPEQIAHVTEPFYRADKSRSRAEGGAGLGLSLCKTIVDAHGASLRFESQPGRGTKVTVEFTT